MDVIFALVAVAAVALVLWDRFVRGRRGTALTISVIAGVLLVGAGIARGADVSRPWPLLALVAGGVLFIVAERRPSESDESPQ